MKNVIDMSRATLVYGTGVGLLMVMSLVLSNVPGVQLSHFLTVPHRLEASALLFSLGTLFGLLAMWRHTARTKQPWKVPQSQVSVSYALFFFATLIAIVLAK